MSQGNTDGRKDIALLPADSKGFGNGDVEGQKLFCKRSGLPDPNNLKEVLNYTCMVIDQLSIDIENYHKTISKNLREARQFDPTPLQESCNMVSLSPFMTNLSWSSL